MEGYLKGSPGRQKPDVLIDVLKGMGSVLIAFSGGMDSALLLKAVKLSGIKALAVTARSPLVPAHEIDDAVRMAEESGIEHIVIETGELEDKNLLDNPPERCFFCKDIRYGKLKEIASGKALKFLIDGTNLDDTGDYRPGIKAALRHGVRGPLKEAGFTKQDIREASRQWGLPVKPSSACLATRFPYGVTLTEERLERVASAEEFLRSMGLREFRVRDHDCVARLEVSDGETAFVIERAKEISGRLRALGYKFISIDMDGFRSGSMNRLLL